MEDFYIGGASVKLFLPIFKMNFPEIVDIRESQRDSVPKPSVARRELPWVNVRKQFPTATRLRPFPSVHCGRIRAHAPGGGRISSSNFSPAPAGHLACAGGWQLAICDS